uniref:CARD domain-containing protein n=1 Tax=Neolamprologus brichardi TaxID=32507 RepID=A0A3Q4G2R2_NEOBR
MPSDQVTLRPAVRPDLKRGIKKAEHSYKLEEHFLNDFYAHFDKDDKEKSKTSFGMFAVLLRITDLICRNVALKCAHCVSDSKRTFSASSSADSPGGSPLQMGNSASAEKLRLARANFVDKVSDPVLNKLLDELQRVTVLTDAEGEAARAKPRGEKARDLIDTVRKKGAEASSKMIAVFYQKKPHVYHPLQLVSIGLFFTYC